MNKILVLDIETTGFSTSKDVILELGICELNTSTGVVIKLFDEIFCSPKLTAKHHKCWVFENNYMTPDEVRGKPPIDHFREQIQKIFTFYSGEITAWNRYFDSRFLKANGFDLGKDIVCPMMQSTDFFKIPGLRGNKWPKAQEAWDILFPDNPRTELHRGYDDADMEARIIYELIKKGVYTPFK